MPDYKKYLPLAITIIAGMAIFFLWDYIQDWILGIVGLGATGAAVYAAKSKDLQSQAKVHDEMYKQHLAESGIKMQQSTEAHDKAVEGVEKVVEAPVKPGLTRRNRTSH